MSARPSKSAKRAPAPASPWATLEGFVGNTPLIRLQRISGNTGNVLLAKLEGNNPAGSVKDRPALSMIAHAEARGDIKPGDTLIEPTSGNTGIALAMVAAVRGYRMILVMPEHLSEERRQTMAAFGAQIVLTPRDGGMEMARDMAQQMEARGEGRILDQFANPDNPRAHYEGTGPEIWRDVPEITHFVAGLGTSGTLMGTGRYLKEQNPDIQIVAVEPPLGERVEGLRNIGEGYIPPVFEQWNGYELLDRKRVVRPRESIEWTRRLVRECGVFAGISAGAALAGAAKVASQIESGTIVFIVCDGGWKYLSTGAYTDDLDAAEANVEGIVYF